MAAINHGGTFYRLDESSQSGDCGEANVMASKMAPPNHMEESTLPSQKYWVDSYL